MYSRFYLWLLLLSGVVLFAYTVFTAQREIVPEWKRYQIEYKGLLVKNAKDDATKNKARQLITEVQQIYLGSLKRVDRCISCHIGAENPLVANADIPLKQHRGDYLKNHPQDKFGCTVCHYGQGR